MQPLTVAVTGATGYIGGRLVPRLLAEGHTVRALSRDVGRLRDVPWVREVEVVEADAQDRASLDRALAGVDVVYHLIHSIDGGDDVGAADREAARNVGAAARGAGVGRIVHLGGLTPQGQGLSPHLRSRHEVGQILLDSGVPAAVLQAAVIIGSGSASFEMLRYLTERLPAMIAPRWVRTRIQPIAVRDVMRYLVGAATLPADVSRRFDIGGPDVLTYLEMMQRYAAAAGLRRRVIVPVPVVSPRLSAHWVNVVTPVPSAIATPLVRSLVDDVVCAEHDIAAWVPDPPEGLVGFDDSVSLALLRVREAAVETRWSSATWPGAPSDPLPTDPDWAGGSLYTDVRQTAVAAGRDDLWRVVEGIGGENGWYSFPLAWAVRGLLDRVVGGVGLRRGRRDPHTLYIGESLDFWRVEEIVPGELLRLRAEMRLPGAAWLEFGIEQVGKERPVLVQRALFHPRGLAGHAYWWAVAPFHGVVFDGMLHNIRREAERAAAAPEQLPAA
jgi:uncharacterized protein YbjT (DUF2867 family)